MSPDTTIRIPARLQTLAATAMLLEKLERLPRSASAGQYRALVGQVHRLLDDVDGDPALESLLNRLPALAELHENRHYAQAGLCRSPLDDAVQAERQARELIEKLNTPR
ncbi:MAG: hypothetical protein ABS84_15405 [Rubrivivax sp. SCN 71-131]|jgi:hypothetical protein|nr:MAG: hypothetical protein ABS84_15405 [Rubrivivax sp. SCN 71-131]